MNALRACWLTHEAANIVGLARARRDQRFGTHVDAHSTSAPISGGQHRMYTGSLTALLAPDLPLIDQASIASAASKARAIDPLTGLGLCEGENIPIERYWSDEDERNFPLESLNLNTGEIAAWCNGTLWVFLPEHLRAWRTPTRRKPVR